MQRGQERGRHGRKGGCREGERRGLEVVCRARSKSAEARRYYRIRDNFAEVTSTDAVKREGAVREDGMRKGDMAQSQISLLCNLSLY